MYIFKLLIRIERAEVQRCCICFVFLIKLAILLYSLCSIILFVVLVRTKTMTRIMEQREYKSFAIHMCQQTEKSA
jgi:hypothetical protein